MVGNYALSKVIDSFIGTDSTENFENKENDLNKNVNEIDDCRKIDLKGNNTLNFQTGTNIPLSPNYYKDYVGKIYTFPENIPNIIPADIRKKHTKYALYKPKLLYDGIWDSDMNSDNGYNFQSWTLTDGNIASGEYWSNDLIRTNKNIPPDYIDESAVTPIVGGEYYTYCNDTVNDVEDKELTCFPSIFNTGLNVNKNQIINRVGNLPSNINVNEFTKINKSPFPYDPAIRKNPL
jgi:hypothetical protein